MTDFTGSLRRRCRNPRCRMMLKTPVSNPREAFCARGCHSSFYRRRCLICEQPMERRTEGQLICGKRRCRNALQARQGLGRYLASSGGVSPVENPIKPGIKISAADARPWRIAAGELTLGQLHCATMPDGSGRQWKGGAFERAEAAGRAALAAIDTDDHFTEPNWREVISPDGARCWVTRGRQRPDGAPARGSAAAAPIDDDLSIPACLRHAQAGGAQ